MKLELCAYSGLKIYPGHGKRMIKVDGKTLIFLNRKCERSHMMKRNPRKITWTILYRRKHKKGLEEETKRKKTKRNTKFQRAVVGATLQDILAKRNQNPEVRKAQREQAIRAAKERSRAAKSGKKPSQGAQLKPAPAKVLKQKAPKPVQAKAPRVGGKR